MILSTLDLINCKDAETERLKKKVKEADDNFSQGDFQKGLSIVINLVKELTEGGR